MPSCQSLSALKLKQLPSTAPFSPSMSMRTAMPTTCAHSSPDRYGRIPFSPLPQLLFILSQEAKTGHTPTPRHTTFIHALTHRPTTPNVELTQHRTSDKRFSHFPSRFHPFYLCLADAPDKCLPRLRETAATAAVVTTTNPRWHGAVPKVLPCTWWHPWTPLRDYCSSA